jgi:hypothetical protein
VSLPGHRASGDFDKFGLGFHLSNALAIMAASWLYSRRPRTAWPFLAAAGGLALQSLAFETLGRSPAWESLMPAIGGLPTPLLAAGGLALSIAVVAWGWFGGKRGRSTPARVDRAAVTA